MKPQSISIIITTYNRPQALELVLQALDDQDYKNNFEVIIADDGSARDTQKLIEQYAKKVKYKLIHVWQEDQGFRAARARNLAVAKSTGELLIFLDGDSVPMSDFVKKHVALAKEGYFVAGNRVLVSESFTQELEADNIKLQDYCLYDFYKAAKENKINRFFPCVRLPLGPLRYLSPKKWRGAKTCNLAIWRYDFYKVNGFDEKFLGWGYEDSDLVIRLQKLGIKRKSGKFAVPVLHLWHVENDRSGEDQNLKYLEEIIKSKRIMAKVGLTIQEGM